MLHLERTLSADEVDDEDPPAPPPRGVRLLILLRRESGHVEFM